MATTEELVKSAEATTLKDPRIAPLGIRWIGSEGISGFMSFSWFEDMEAVKEFLTVLGPAVFELEAARQSKFLDVASPLMDTLVGEGFGEELRNSLNALPDNPLCIDWWGTFEDLCLGKGALAEELRAEFYSFTEDFDDEEDENPDAHGVEPIAASQIEEFIDFLRTYGI